MSLVNHLKSIGLEDKEARVYVAMLELGPATVLEIAGKAEVTRPTAYVVIEALKKMGLVNTETRGKKQYFVAESPDQIKVNLDREQKLIELRKEEYGQIFPSLLELYSKVKTPENESTTLVDKELILKKLAEIELDTNILSKEDAVKRLREAL